MWWASVGFVYMHVCTGVGRSETRRGLPLYLLRSGRYPRASKSTLAPKTFVLFLFRRSIERTSESHRIDQLYLKSSNQGSIDRDRSRPWGFEPGPTPVRHLSSWLSAGFRSPPGLCVDSASPDRAAQPRLFRSGVNWPRFEGLALRLNNHSYGTPWPQPEAARSNRKSKQRRRRKSVHLQTKKISGPWHKF